MNYLIIGGTGTLGQAVIKELLSHYDDPSLRIWCFSRDEHKQSKMKKEFADNRIKFILGDIRDRNSMQGIYSLALRVNIDYVFHFAALKHVDILEENPIESILTNVNGTKNVLDFCEVNKIKDFVFSSTDKAVSPINAYGLSKALAEKVIQSYSYFLQMNVKIFRWGNILFSNGSALGYFKKTLLSERKAYITNMSMTRFWIKLDDAVNFLIQESFTQCYRVGAYIPPMKAAKVERVIHRMAFLLNIKTYEIVETEIRRGEKLHEYLEHGHESSENCEQYSDEELDRLLRAYL